MTCRECDGSGTLFVLPGYVDRYQPAVAPEHPDYVKVEAMRASLAWSVYPCPECQPDRFREWSGGKFDPGPATHNSGRPADRPKRNGRGRGQDPLPMPPGDLDPLDDVSNWSMTRKDLQ